MAFLILYNLGKSCLRLGLIMKLVQAKMVLDHLIQRLTIPINYSPLDPWTQISHGRLVQPSLDFLSIPESFSGSQDQIIQAWSPHPHPQLFSRGRRKRGASLWEKDSFGEGWGGLIDKFRSLYFLLKRPGNLVSRRVMWLDLYFGGKKKTKNDTRAMYYICLHFCLSCSPA